MAWLGSLSLPQAPCWATTVLPLACFLLPCSRLQCHFLFISMGLAEFRYLHVAYIDLFLLTVGASLHCVSSFPGCLCLGLVLCCTVVACSFSIFSFPCSSSCWRKHHPRLCHRWTAHPGWAGQTSGKEREGRKASRLWYRPTTPGSFISDVDGAFIYFLLFRTATSLPSSQLTVTITFTSQTQ